MRTALSIGLGVAMTFASVTAASGAEPDEVKPPPGGCLTDREALTFEQSLDVKGTGAERLGIQVSKEEAARIDELSDTRDSLDFDKLRQDAVEGLGDNLVSVTWSYTDGVELRVKDPALVKDGAGKLADSYRLKEYSTVVAVPGGLSEAARNDKIAKLTDPESYNTMSEYGFTGSTGDEYCGQVIAYFDDPDLYVAREALAKFIDLDGIVVQYRAPEEGPQLAVGRTDFQSTQSGGLEYEITTLLADNGICTSNVPWYRNNPNGSRTRFLVTAGHCFPRATWSTQNPWGSPPNQVWWNQFTSGANVRQGGHLVAWRPATIQFGGDADIAVIQVGGQVSGGNRRTAVNKSSQNYIWDYMGWWQWSANWNTSTSGGDAVGDSVCHSGRTAALLADEWNQSPKNCGILTSRSESHGIDIDNPQDGMNDTFLWGLRRVLGARACTGDSGGTVWRENSGGKWIAGVVHSLSQSWPYTMNSGARIRCSSIYSYSHIAHVKDRMGLTAPAGMS